MSAHHLPVLVPLCYLLGALLAPLLGRSRPTVARWLAIAVGGLATALAVMGAWSVRDGSTVRYQLGGWAPPMGIELVLDPLSALVTVLIGAVSTLVLLHAGPNAEQELAGKRVWFYSAALLLLCGLSGMTLTGDLFNLYVFLEISALSGYALVAVGDKRAPLAAFRYLMFGTLGASMYLLGLCLLYMKTGSLNMADLQAILLASNDTAAPLLLSRPVIAGVALMALGLGLKMALFPMHGWLADAYTCASSPSSALIAPIGTKVAAYALIRLLLFVVGPAAAALDGVPLLRAIGWLGAAGVVWGSIMAVAQTDLKRMLAYSSVGQVGYIAMGIGMGSVYGLIGALLHIVNHACMKGCLFLVAGNLILRLGHDRIPGIDGRTAERMPWTMGAFSVAAMSMVGLPPTAGFFSKWYLALGAVEQSSWVWLGALVVSSLLNAAYFARIIERAYLAEPGSVRGGGPDGEVGWVMLAPTLLLAVLLLVLGLGSALLVGAMIVPALPGGLR